MLAELLSGLGWRGKGERTGEEPTLLMAVEWMGDLRSQALIFLQWVLGMNDAKPAEEEEGGVGGGGGVEYFKKRDEKFRSELRKAPLIHCWITVDKNQVTKGLTWTKVEI
jgi:hypothetical protein